MNPKLDTFCKNFYIFTKLRQNGAPSRFEKRGLDARAFPPNKKINRRNVMKSICRNGCPQRNDPNGMFNE
ncbi:hypothetical protein BWD13_00055 [Leptospira santarosai serovar Grippotyphosa]|nr:hypothetical protein BWD13_00055 [Leptospira santarosai serovar Grippotyphosa]